MSKTLAANSSDKRGGMILNLTKKQNKIFVLDSSVVTASPYSLLAFDEHTVVLVDALLDELSKLMNRLGEQGRNAQETLRLLDSLRLKGNLTEGAPLPNGGTLRIEAGNSKVSGFPSDWNDRSAGTSVLKTAMRLQQDRESYVVLVSNDISLRVKADFLGIDVQEYRSDKVKEEYFGRRELFADRPGMVSEIYAGKNTKVSPEIAGTLTRGEYVLLHDAENPSSTALCCYDGCGLSLLRYGLTGKNIARNVYGVSPRNVGQKFAIDALMAPAAEVPLVVLKGPAGTAKTLLALAGGLEQVLGDKSNHAYDRILVARPNIKFDEDIGYLKGTEEDKIGPLIRPIWDNLEFLTRAKNSKDGVISSSYAQYLFDNGLIVAQALAYMRGRSISNTWIIIDEAQNMTPLQAFGIISRAGVGSKIILAGDPEQIDSPYLDKWNNGLSYASERMKGSPLCRQVTFSADECERSPLAQEAIQRLSLKGQN